MSGTPEELRGLLVNVHLLLKTQLTKELASVVRYSQETKRASWRPEKRPNWWVEGKTIDAVDVCADIPDYGPVRTLSADSMRAALVAFYVSRINYEENVACSAVPENLLRKNPILPENYALVAAGKLQGADGGGGEEVISETDSDFVAEEEAPLEDIEEQEAPDAGEADEEEVVDDVAEDVAEETAEAIVKEVTKLVVHDKESDGEANEDGDEVVVDDKESDGEANEDGDEAVVDDKESDDEDNEDGDEVVDEDKNEEEKVVQDEKDNDSEDDDGNEADSEEDDERPSPGRDTTEAFNLASFHELFNRIKDDPAENRFSVLRMMLVQVMEEQEGRKLTRTDKELRIRLGFESAKAKVRSDYEAIRRRKLQEIEKTKSALRVQMQKTRARIPADVKSMTIGELDELEPCDTMEEVLAQLRDKRRPRNIRNAATEARPRRGAAQSAAAKNRALLLGTPSRARVGNEPLYDAEGNEVQVLNLFSKNNSPVVVVDPTPAPRPARSRLNRGKPPSGAGKTPALTVRATAKRRGRR